MKKEKKLEFSKKLVRDIRGLLWVISVGGIALAFYCVYKDYTSSLPWIASLVGLPWASHATVCGLYLNKSKAENTGADGEGIIYAAARHKSFLEEYEENVAKYVSEPQYSYTESEDEYEYEVNEEEDYFIDSPPI